MRHSNLNAGMSQWVHTRGAGLAHIVLEKYNIFPGESVAGVLKMVCFVFAVWVFTWVIAAMTKICATGNI